MAGGQGTTHSSGDVVLKPVLDEREAEWLAGVLHALPPRDDLRVIRPIPSATGAWVVDGWSAWERLDGDEVGGRWRDVLDVSARFHELVADVPWSDAIATGHRWAHGHEFAWGEREIEVPTRFDDVVAELQARRGPLDLPAQLAHSDLCNNVLVHDGLAPAVIDVSPCWRPARYADAIVVADSIGWFGAGAEAIEPLADDEGVQLLVRAILFRLGSAVELFSDEPARLDAEVAAYERLLSMLPD